MLTFIQIKNLQPKKTKYDVAHINGLSLRVSTTGKKTWRLKKRVGGRVTVKTLGDWPGVSIKEAELLAAEAFEQMKSTAAIRITTRELFDEWYDVKKEAIINHADIRERYLKYIDPTLGEVPFEDIKPQELIALINEDLGARQKWETIKRLCGELKQLEVFAQNCGHIKTLKLQGIASAFQSPKRGLKHRPTIPPNELPEALQELKGAAIKAPTALATLQVALYTLLRPREYCALEWSWIKDDVIEVPAEVMKMKRPFSVPITRQLKEVLSNRPRVSQYVLASPDRPNQPVRIEALSLFLRRHGFRGRLVPHGIRSIGRTWMEEQAIPYAVAEMCLSHTVGSQVSLAYNHAELLPERQRAMQLWADYVEQCFTNLPAYLL